MGNIFNPTPRASLRPPLAFPTPLPSHTGQPPPAAQGNLVVLNMCGQGGVRNASEIVPSTGFSNGSGYQRFYRSDLSVRRVGRFCVQIDLCVRRARYIRSESARAVLPTDLSVRRTREFVFLTCVAVREARGSFNQQIYRFEERVDLLPTEISVRRARGYVY